MKANLSGEMTPQRTFSLVSEPGAHLLNESEARNPHSYAPQIPRAQHVRQSSKQRGYYGNDGFDMY